MSLTVRPMRLQVASDYTNVAEKLLEDTPLGAVRARLLNPEPMHLELAVDMEAGPLAEVVACELLREFWFYDWMPVAVTIDFVPGSLRPGSQGRG